MNLEDCWLDAAWSSVRPRLPDPPARVIELGCGPRGGIVPALLDAGYDAVGVDPAAPEPDGPGSPYHQVEFEQFPVQERFDAIVASRSLHHVADLDEVAEAMVQAIVRRGSLLVVEWDHERFDEATARWCFDRLAPVSEHPDPGPEPEADATAAAPGHGHEHGHGHGDGHGGFVRGHHDRWVESGQPWGAYFRSWVTEHGLHPGQAMVQALDARFKRTGFSRGPYFHCYLDGVTEADEQAAIDAGEIRANGFRYTATALVL